MPSPKRIKWYSVEKLYGRILNNDHREIMDSIYLLYRRDVIFGGNGQPLPNELGENRGGKLVVEFRDHKGEFADQVRVASKSGQRHKLFRGKQAIENEVTDEAVLDVDVFRDIDWDHFEKVPWGVREYWNEAFKDLVELDFSDKFHKNPFYQICKSEPDFHDIENAINVLRHETSNAAQIKKDGINTLKFSQDLNDALKSSSLHLLAVAQKIGISPRTLRRYQNNQVKIPPKQTVHNICQGLDLDFEKYFKKA